MGNRKERDCLGELGIGRRRILVWILKKIIWEAKTWIHVAHDMAKCQAVVNCQGTFWLLKMQGIS
jgi:hypothetical protein